MRRRRLASVLTAVNLLVLAATLFQGRRVTAAAAPETLRARALELVDRDGRVRAQLDVESSGEVVLRLRDPKGDIRVKLGAGADGSGLVLLDGSTEVGVQVLAKQSGTALTLAKNGQRRLITP